jgi:hypothetical protein
MCSGIPRNSQISPYRLQRVDGRGLRSNRDDRCRHSNRRQRSLSRYVSTLRCLCPACAPAAVAVNRLHGLVRIMHARVWALVRGVGSVGRLSRCMHSPSHRELKLFLLLFLLFYRRILLWGFLLLSATTLRMRAYTFCEHAHTHPHPHTFTFTHTYTHTRTHYPHHHPQIYARAHSHTQAVTLGVRFRAEKSSTFRLVLITLSSFIHTCSHMHTYTFIHKHITHISPYMHTHTHIHTCLPTFVLSQTYLYACMYACVNKIHACRLVDVPEMRYTSQDVDEKGIPVPRGEICFRGDMNFKGKHCARR